MSVLVKGEGAAVASTTRERMIEAAVRALQHRGLAGMSFTDVLVNSGAARGAIYHHFPGGKHQLVAEAAGRNGQDVRAHLAALPTASPRGVVQAFLAQVRPVMLATSQGSGCAVAAVTVQPDGDSDELRRVAATAFASWAEQLGSALRTAGMAPAPAADLASLLVALLEGAQVLCRAAGDVEPFERAARAVLPLVETRATPQGSRPGRGR
jgi:TetR/AcrR family transcriptional repressor of lmrAB and yxaGH operons